MHRGDQAPDVASAGNGPLNTGPLNTGSLKRRVDEDRVDEYWSVYAGSVSAGPINIGLGAPGWGGTGKRRAVGDWNGLHRVGSRIASPVKRRHGETHDLRLPWTSADWTNRPCYTE